MALESLRGRDLKSFVVYSSSRSAFVNDETYATIREIAHLLGLQTIALSAAKLPDLDDTKLSEFMAREQDIQSSIDALHPRPNEK